MIEKKSKKNIKVEESYEKPSVNMSLYIANHKEEDVPEYIDEFYDGITENISSLLEDFAIVYAGEGKYTFEFYGVDDDNEFSTISNYVKTLQEKYS